MKKSKRKTTFVPGTERQSKMSMLLDPLGVSLSAREHNKRQVSLKTSNNTLMVQTQEISAEKLQKS
jgi:hypothetical protein